MLLQRCLATSISIVPLAIPILYPPDCKENLAKDTLETPDDRLTPSGSQLPPPGLCGKREAPCEVRQPASQGIQGLPPLHHCQ